MADMTEKMIKKKNVLKNQFQLFKDKQIVFSLLRTSKTLSLGEFDECETHLFLSLFFYDI